MRVVDARKDKSSVPGRVIAPADLKVPEGASVAFVFLDLTQWVDAVKRDNSRSLSGLYGIFPWRSDLPALSTW